MKAPNWRNRHRRAAALRACREDGHDWLPADPVTGRRFCRRMACQAMLPGLPEAWDAAGWIKKLANEPFDGRRPR